MAEEMSSVWVQFQVPSLETLFYVHEFSGTECLNQDFRISLTLVTAGPVTFSQIIGQRAALELRRDPTDPKDKPITRYVHGIVGRFKRVKRDANNDAFIYEALLVPQEARLMHRSDCRIFQEKDVEQILDEVFDLWGGAQNHVFTRKKPPFPRDYCVQYRESDWDFFNRLLEEEGYYYFFDHGKEGASLCMVNRAGAALPITPDSATEEQDSAAKPQRPLTFNAIGGAHPGRETIFELGLGTEICPAKVDLEDYFFQLPQSPPQAHKTAVAKDKGFGAYVGVDEDLAQYENPAIFEPEEEGHLKQSDKLIDNMAEVRLQQARQRALQVDGKSTCIRFLPGYYFTLTAADHSGSRAAGPGALEPDLVDTEYMLIQVDHAGETGAPLRPVEILEQIGKAMGSAGAPMVESRCNYHNSFRCLPMDVPFRPLRKTPKPVIHGVQTAEVVGPDSEEVYTDEHGRVKVMFHWDRAAKKNKQQGKALDTSSCWIRVSQVWAGQGWGAVWLPRKGHEVIVSFEEGDPDRPIITGRVYHAANTPALSLPKHKTRSTIKSNSVPDAKGRRSNEIRFEDKKGAEQVYVHAQRNMDEVVGHDHTRTVTHDEKVTVKEGDRSVDVLKGNQSTNISGNLTETTFKDRTVSVVDGYNTRTVKQKDSIIVEKGDRTVGVTEGCLETFVGNKCSETVLQGREVTISKGDNDIKVCNGDDLLNVMEGKKIDQISGVYDISVNGDQFCVRCGSSTLRMEKDGTITISGAGGEILIESSGITINGKTVDING